VSINDDTHHYVYILMYTISFIPQPTMKVNIHNQCSDFKLIEGEYFIINANYNDKPDREVDTGNMMNVDLIPFLSTFGSGLTYELQSRYDKHGNQRESTHVRFLVAWKSEGYKKFFVFVHLMEYDKWFDWDRINLKECYQRYASQFCTYTNPIKNTWLIYNDTALMTELELDFTQRDGVLNITISEGIRDEYTKRSEWIYLKR
jgi:hypothetical protein